MNNQEIIAKFGGSSVAQPEYVKRHVEHDNPWVVVVSALGVDYARGHHKKMTDMLLGVQEGAVDPREVEERLAILIDDMQIEGSAVVHAAKDLQTWQSRDWPIEALGEYWSAQLYARYLCRQFVDAGEVVRTNSQGELDVEASEWHVKSRLKETKKYIVPGFYGRDEAGNVHTLGRGSSDITGAIIARAKGVAEYQNLSDVNGFMTADPSIVHDARLVPRLTYEEVEEMDCGLLHARVCSMLVATGIRTVMRNTFGELGNRGTVVESEHIRAQNAATHIASKEVSLVDD